MINPDILLISNKYDYATDYVALKLNKIGASYFRLNRDEFLDMEITYFPTKGEIIGKYCDYRFKISQDNLKSIFFRAPVFLRNFHLPPQKPEIQINRSEWSAFLRSLIVFENINWVNHPSSTYTAEVKPYQLKKAYEVGLCIPQTIVANNIKHIDPLVNNGEIVVKGLDNPLFRIDDEEAFFYTNITTIEELKKSEFSISPVIFQEVLHNKIDIRVTVINSCVFAVKIVEDETSIVGDWRRRKDSVSYIPISLPREVELKCIDLTKRLGLKFGAIDFALSDGKYYFFEINPTGEWAWLVHHCNLPIDIEIAKLLCG